jgi:hypothetical protein
VKQKVKLSLSLINPLNTEEEKKWNENGRNVVSDSNLLKRKEKI